MTQLQIRTYGLSDTTLEEIFLKVASNIHDGEIMREIQHEDITDNGRYATRVRSSSARSIDSANRGSMTADQQKVLGVGGASNYEVNNDDVEVQVNAKVVITPSDGKPVTYLELPSMDQLPKVVKNFPPPVPEYTSGSVFIKHLYALIIKRFHKSKRNKMGLMSEIIGPAFFVCIAMILIMIVPAQDEEQPLEMHPWNYPTWGLNYPTETFVANHHKDGDWPKRYIDELVSKRSFGTRCIPGNTISKPCLNRGPNMTSFGYEPGALENITLLDCHCSRGAISCPEGAEGLDPPKVQLASYDMLVNMTGRNISDYLVKTQKRFYKRRYGGFDFGIGNPIKDANISVIEDNLERILDLLPIPQEFGSSTTLAGLAAGLIDDLIRRKLDNIRVWFNNKGWTTSVGYTNAVNNLVLRASVKSQQLSLDAPDWLAYKDPGEFGISVINHPMNLTETQLEGRSIRQMFTSLSTAICIIFALSFVPASFVMNLIEERIGKVKHLHFVSSVKSLTYWTSAAVWDLSMYLVTAIICVIIFIVFDAEAYVSPESLPSLMVTLFLYGWATIPMMYPVNFVISVPSLAYVMLACANLLVGIITTITVFVLENFDDKELQEVAKILKEVFLIFPQYCLGRSLMELAAEHTKGIIAGKFGFESTRTNRFEYDFLGKYMLCMFAQGVAFFILTLLIEFKIFSKLYAKSMEIIVGSVDLSGSNDSSKEDVDVKQERDRVMKSVDNSDVLIIKDLSKRYSRKGKLAVDHLTFGVKPGECFGLLGVNGAGKTTTFKMLTGDTEPSGGAAYVNGCNVLTDLEGARRNIGYCPQFDALNPLLTGREHLMLYARLRGLSENCVKKYTEWCLKRLGLTPYADRAAGTYSGGNKRKLSTAIALIGKPAIVFLDEPTSGMDPGARRFLWNCILEMVKGGQSVVLTSHSMEECEALCSRLAIMVNGTFQCHGSIQHLKNRFGSGYTLTLKCGGDEMACKALEKVVLDQISNASLKEFQLGQLKFHLPLHTTKLPNIFSLMESAKSNPELCLEDYSISQMTLDEVFIHFASEQTEEAES